MDSTSLEIRNVTYLNMGKYSCENKKGQYVILLAVIFLKVYGTYYYDTTWVSTYYIVL